MIQAPKVPADLLNKTLKKAITEFHSEGLTRWFVSYGTLLGLVRDQSCIDGDDDIDICFHIDDYDKVDKILERNFGPRYQHPLNPLKVFIRRKATEELAPIDIYFCRVNEDGDYFDVWEKVTWSDVYDEDGQLPFITWEGLKVYVPKNYQEKLIKRYGDTWNQRIKRGAGKKSDGYREVKVL